jgi:hypothetical protein
MFATSDCSKLQSVGAPESSSGSWPPWSCRSWSAEQQTPALVIVEIFPNPFLIEHLSSLSVLFFFRRRQDETRKIRTDSRPCLLHCLKFGWLYKMAGHCLLEDLIGCVWRFPLASIILKLRNGLGLTRNVLCCNCVA